MGSNSMEPISHLLSTVAARLNVAALLPPGLDKMYSLIPSNEAIVCPRV